MMERRPRNEKKAGELPGTTPRTGLREHPSRWKKYNEEQRKRQADGQHGQQVCLLTPAAACGRIPPMFSPRIQKTSEGVPPGISPPELHAF